MRSRFRASQSNTTPSVSARHERLLALSVGGLAACVLTLMSLSLAGCEMFRSSGTTESAISGASRESAAKTSAKHVAPSAPSFAIAGISDEPDMRVRIASAMTEAAIGSVPLGWKPTTTPPSASSTTQAPTTFAPRPVYVEPIGGGRRAAATSSRGTGGTVQLLGPVKVAAPTPGSSEWVITDATGQPQRIVADAIEFSSTGYDNTAPRTAISTPQRLLTLGDLAYPGRLRLIARSDTPTPSIDVIEHVPLDTYLRGVVVKEMFPNWPLEAFRVQAICARTYALHERVRAFGKIFDVEASQRDQAYSGATANSRAIEAVDSTRGLILTHRAQVLRAYYSSSCGGRPGAARNTWPSGPGFEYNQALPIQAYVREFACDKASPQFSWTVTRDRDELVKRLRAYGESSGMLIRKIENIASLEVLKVEPTGRPAEYKLIEPGGRWFQIKSEDLRLACNAGAAGLPAITNKDRVLSGDITFKVLPAATSPGAKINRSATAGTIEISGRGFGHGVGMCQYCTKAMAERGDDWRAMLTRFYPGADIMRAYK